MFTALSRMTTVGFGGRAGRADIDSTRSLLDSPNLLGASKISKNPELIGPSTSWWSVAEDAEMSRVVPRREENTSARRHEVRGLVIAVRVENMSTRSVSIGLLTCHLGYINVPHDLISRIDME